MGGQRPSSPHKPPAAPSQLHCLRRCGGQGHSSASRPRRGRPDSSSNEGPVSGAASSAGGSRSAIRGSCAGGWLCGQGRQLQVLLCPGAPPGEPTSCHLQGCLLGHRAPPPPGTARPGAQCPRREGGSPTGRVAPEAQLLPKEPPCPSAEAGAGPPAQTTDGAHQLTSGPALGSAPKDPPWHLQPPCHLLPGTRLRVLRGGETAGEQGLRAA